MVACCLFSATRKQQQKSKAKAWANSNKQQTFFFDRNLQNYLPHTVRGGDVGALFRYCQREGGLEGPPAAWKASLAIVFVGAHISVLMNPLYDYLDYETVPQKKRHTQINHSNEHSRPLIQYPNTTACMRSYRYRLVVFSGGELLKILIKSHKSQQNVNKQLSLCAFSIRHSNEN